MRPLSVCSSSVLFDISNLVNSFGRITVKLDPVLINGFNESAIHAVVTAPPAQCLTTASATIHNTQIGEKIPTAAPRIGRPPNPSSQTNSALAMSQLGTVYATKRRRRNGKR